MHVKTRLVLIVILFNFIVPMMIGGFNRDYISNNKVNLYDDNIPKQAFSKEDFTPILSQEKQGLGSINVTNITFHEEGLKFFITYQELSDDFGGGALNISYKGIKFVKTVYPARVTNLNESIQDRYYLTIELNETLSVQYNQSKDLGEGKVEGYMIYQARLYPSILKNLYVKNATIPLTRLNITNDYTIDGYDFVKFDYNTFFNGVMFNNFTMHLIWDYNLTISNWALTQYPAETLIVENEEQTITPKFNYRFNIIGKKFNGTFYSGTYPFLEYQIEASDLMLNLTVNLPDKSLLKNHKLKINNVIISDNNLPTYLNNDKSIKVLFMANNSNFYANFSADFTIQFLDPLDFSWAIDRLVSLKNTRERIYFPMISSGPSSIYVKYIKINEPTISIDQVSDNYSQFGRKVAYFAANISKLEGEYKNSLIFTANSTKKQGLEIQLPYLINGEICPFSIEYGATRNLRVIITDNINTPIAGIEVEIYYYDVLYGTYISNEKDQPSYPLKTDENGEILIEDVPNGNYTLVVIQNDEDVFESIVSSFIDINYVKTDIIHFPLVILIFGSLSGLIFVIGLTLHLKNGKKR